VILNLNLLVFKNIGSMTYRKATIALYIYCNLYSDFQQVYYSRLFYCLVFPRIRFFIVILESLL